MSKITKKDIKDLKENCEEKIRYTETIIENNKGRITALEAMIELLERLETK